VLGVSKRVLGQEHPGTLLSAGNLAAFLAYQGKYADAERIEREVLGVKRRVLGEEHPSTLKSSSNLADHPDTLSTALSLGQVRSDMRAEQPTRMGGKAATRRAERAAAPALSPTALAEAEAKARAAEAELLAMLDLEEPEAGVGGGSSGKSKGKAKGKAKVQGGR
jgi:hypothetical protein